VCVCVFLFECVCMSLYFCLRVDVYLCVGTCMCVHEYTYVCLIINQKSLQGPVFMYSYMCV